MIEGPGSEREAQMALAVPALVSLDVAARLWRDFEKNKRERKRLGRCSRILERVARFDAELVAQHAA